MEIINKRVPQTVETHMFRFDVCDNATMRRKTGGILGQGKWGKFLAPQAPDGGNRRRRRHDKKMT